MSNARLDSTTMLACLVGVCLGVIAVALLIDRPELDLALTIAIGSLPALLVVLAVPSGRRGPVAVPAALLLLLLDGALLGILFASGTGLLGWPRAAIVMLLALWIAPLPVVALAYAWHFRRDPIDHRVLERLRRSGESFARRGGE